MYIAAEMISILFAVSDGISVENCMPSISTLKPASLPISLMRSTITPSIVLVLVSRKVKGMPVGVEPTLSTLSSALAPISVRLERMRASANFLSSMKSPFRHWVAGKNLACALTRHNGESRGLRPGSNTKIAVLQVGLCHQLGRSAAPHGAAALNNEVAVADAT